MNEKRMHVLYELPLIFSSTLDLHKVISSALSKLKDELEAEAATVFILNDQKNELTFWALEGGRLDLAGKKMPASAGIVGTVISSAQATLVNDVSKHSNFFSTIDAESNFRTRNLICVPLKVRSKEIIGAMQILNRKNNMDFSSEDLDFLERISFSLALALDNANLHARMLERTHALQILERRKEEMITVIAHEFRTPLNVIQTSADMIASGMLKDAQAVSRMSAMLQNGVQRFTKLINQISKLGALNRAEFTLEKEAVTLSACFDYLKLRFADAFKKRSLQVTIEQPEHDLKVFADKALLQVVLFNLLSNAVRFTADGGSIKVGASSGQGLVRIYIQDTGIGIAEEQYSLIFQKFYEVTDAMTHSSGEFEFKSCGLGLGLATVQEILKLHGSEIELQSTLGKGSTFAFHLALVPHA